MPRLIALEWNQHEARVAVATSARGERIVVEQAFTLPLAPTTNEAGDTVVEIGPQIAEALKAHGVAAGEALVAIGRTSIELRRLTLPPAPDDELPDMVRLQATREFHALEEDWLLDYIPQDTQADMPRNVLAAAVPSEPVRQIERVCEAAGLKPHRVVLRPCAAAALLNRLQPDRVLQLRLLVDLLGDEADLIVVQDGRVVFLRTARLPGDPLADAEAATALLGEIRRTMAAAQNQTGGAAVSSIVLCGSGAAENKLCQSLQSRIETPVEPFSPFVGLELSKGLRQALPEQPQRFAPLLGMLADELRGTRHAIDFLHPRRRPPPPNRSRQYMLAGTTAVVLVLGYLFWSWYDRTSLEQDVEALTQQSKALDERVAKAAKIEQNALEIRKWAQTDITWLDELYDLCNDFPPPKDAMLAQFTADTAASRGPRIELQGFVRAAAIVDQLEKKLRDSTHHVEGEGRNVDNSQKGYAYRFKSSLWIDVEKPDKTTDKPSEKPATTPSRSGRERR